MRKVSVAVIALSMLLPSISFAQSAYISQKNSDGFWRNHSSSQAGILYGAPPSDRRETMAYSFNERSYLRIGAYLKEAEKLKAQGQYGEACSAAIKAANRMEAINRERKRISLPSKPALNESDAIMAEYCSAGS